MNILIVSDTHGLIDGVSTHINLEMEYFKKQGHNVTIVSTNTPYTTDYYVKRFKPYYKCFDANPHTLIRRLKAKAPFDILYSQSLQPQGLYFTLILSAHFKIPYISRFHSYIPIYMEYVYPDFAGFGIKLLMRTTLTILLKLIFHHPKRVIISVPHKKLMDYITNKLNVNKKRILINHIPVPLAKEKKIKLTNFSKNTPYIFISVGRINIEKNFPFLVEIWNKYLSVQYPNARWRIIGAGPLSEQTKIKVKAKERVDFLGNINHSDVLNNMQSADLMLHSSLSETFGLVIAEAKSCGLPVVALNDYGGAAAQFKSGKVGGFLVNNQEEFADKVKLIFSNKEYYNNISINNFNDIANNYSTKEMDKLLKHFKETSKIIISNKEKRRMLTIAYWIRILVWKLPLLTNKFVERVI